MRMITAQIVRDPEVVRWTFAVALNLVAGIWAIFIYLSAGTSRSPVDVPLDIGLIGLFLLVAVARKRFRLTWGGDEGTSSLAPGFHALLLAIGLHVLFDQTLLDRTRGLWAGVGIGLVLSVPLLWSNRPVNRFAAMFTTAFMCLAMWSVVQVANCLLDGSPGQEVRTTVVDKATAMPHCSYGGRYTGGRCSGSYRSILALSPTPQGFPDALAVSGGLYDHEKIGGSLCLTGHSGRFGAGWFRFRPCPKGPTS